MKDTIKQRKQKLYDETTKARSHFHAVERKVSGEVAKKHPELKWYEQMDIVEKDAEYIKAQARLLALCDACNIIGIESGE